MSSEQETAKQHYTDDEDALEAFVTDEHECMREKHGHGRCRCACGGKRYPDEILGNLEPFVGTMDVGGVRYRIHGARERKDR